MSALPGPYNNLPFHGSLLKLPHPSRLRYGRFQKLGVPSLRVLIIRILFFLGYYIRVPYFRKPPYSYCHQIFKRSDWEVGLAGCRAQITMSLTRKACRVTPPKNIFVVLQKNCMHHSLELQVYKWYLLWGLKYSTDFGRFGAPEIRLPPAHYNFRLISMITPIRVRFRILKSLLIRLGPGRIPRFPTS